MSTGVSRAELPHETHSRCCLIGRNVERLESDDNLERGRGTNRANETGGDPGSAAQDGRNVWQCSKSSYSPVRNFEPT